MNETIESAREMGVTIIHAPSGTMDFYAGASQRKAAQAVAYHAAPEAFQINDWCYLDPDNEAPLPIDDSDGGCDQPCSNGEPCEERTGLDPGKLLKFELSKGILYRIRVRKSSISFNPGGK